MRPLPSIILVTAALAVVIGLSVASALREQARLTREFTAAARQQAQASREALTARLDAIDRDARMLVGLVDAANGVDTASATAEHRAWESAFQALAAVVAPYHAIALVEATGTPEVIASDPSRTSAHVAEILPHLARLSRAAATAGAAGESVRIDDRSLLLYAAAARGGRAVVLASETAALLGGVPWTRLAAARLVITDPSGVVWSGCETPRGCRASSLEAVRERLDPRPASTPGAWQGARVVGPKPAPIVELSETLGRPAGDWTVTSVASTRPIAEREASLVSHVVLTAIAAALAVAGVGAVIARQQRKAAALKGQLQYAQALASARETSERLVENAPIGVLGVSRNGRVVLTNRFLTDRVGEIRVGERLGSALCDPRASWLRELEPVIARAAEGAGGAPELHCVGSGERRFLVRIVPVRSGSTDVRTFVLVEDQSELSNLEQQLVRAEKLITVGVLSAGIAHEIGSPLAVIRGRAEQVLRAAPAAHSDDLRVIVKHIDHITSTIRRVLDFSRRQAIERRPVALDAAVDRARALLGWKVDARRVELDVAIERDLPLLSADPDQLEQVIVNLLLNACDASAPGGRIVVAARRARRPVIGAPTTMPDGGVEFDVADRGCGIAAEHVNSVFDPFFTTKKRGEGTGLGLSIAASIVRNHGGRIDLASAPGRGTTVTVSWPAAPASVARPREQVRA